jgi:hypothetical protein
MGKTSKSKPGKPANERNPLVLGAEVCRTGKRRVLGKIVKVTKSLLTVQWDTGNREVYGRSGQAFFGQVGKDGEAVKHSLSGKPLEDLWGDEDDVRITIPTESAKKRITQGLEGEAKLAGERAAAHAKIESDPTYQKRQAELTQYGKLLEGIGTLENSWANAENFRIELFDIEPKHMDRLVTALREVLPYWSVDYKMEK